MIRILTEELFRPYYVQFLRNKKTSQAGKIFTDFGVSINLEQNFVKLIAEKLRGMIDRNLLALDSLKEFSKQFSVCALSPNPGREKEVI